MIKSVKNLLLGLGLLATPLLANSDEDALIAAMAGFGLVFLVVYIVVLVLFLLSQSKFADAMRTSNPMNNTSGVWIWTQLIPFWSLIAVPVTLVKLNAQFQAYVAENNLTFNDVKMYSNVWGWVWYGGTIASLIPVVNAIAWIVAIVGFVGFWVHISGVRKSIEFAKTRNN